MDEHTHLQEQSRSKKPRRNPLVYAGAFFPNSRHLAIEGGTFTSNNTIASQPSDYLRLPLGSIDLRREIRLDAAAGVVSRNYGQSPVHRMYSAQVECRSTPMTVALYQGDGGEEEWRESVARHSRLRDPHILQIFAIASSCGIYAITLTIQIELIPFEQFLESFRHSAISQVYIHAYAVVDRNEVVRHYGSTLEWRFTIIRWIRRSTGRLCIEFGPTHSEDRVPIMGGLAILTPPDNIHALHDLDLEPRVIASLALRQWYTLCSVFLTQHRSADISAQANVKPNSIIRWPPGCRFEHTTMVASAMSDRAKEVVLTSWLHHGRGMTTGHGPIRCNSGEAFGSKFSVLHAHRDHATWFAQANYILSRLPHLSNYGHYVLVERVTFSIEISQPEEDPPDGYLFLCSPTEFKTAPNSFRWPDQPAYWCLDPSGSEPLSDEEAAILGFPCPELRTQIHLAFWYDAVYAGLRKFHKGKGFDPDTQDVARELGYPLYEMSIPLPNVALGGGDESDHSHSSDSELIQDDPLEQTVMEQYVVLDQDNKSDDSSTRDDDVQAAAMPPL
ncbi:hypothetical protein MSAN_02500500 [Mycena sanguinolenta]|uniref:Uncharacterized protein n=1 Tax=Mycena sanguinolenta TaxID=230812 RepID=A0A8H6U392_9AGAR|nr:hypothetical protein MSAN_02500500 [Mycena sanguinolenta]